MPKLAFLLLLLVGNMIFAQQSPRTGSIAGVITTSDNKPAAFVSVQVKHAGAAGVTDERGRFTIRRLPSGAHMLLISLVGYQTLEREILVSENENTDVVIQLKLAEQELREVVVNGNRKSYISEKPSVSLRLNAELIEIPQNITVATKQTLNDMGLLSKTEIFRLSSGVTKSFGGSMDMTVQIRGTNATYNTYRNGIGGPIWWNAQEDAAMVERLEFVKGPAGFMMANAEPGGLINTVTKQPTHQSIAEIGFGVGSWNMMRTTIDLGGEFKKEGKLTYRLNAGVQKNNEFYQFGKFGRVFFAPVLKYDFSENTSVTIENNYVMASAQENTHNFISRNEKLWDLPISLAINDPNHKPWAAADNYNRVFLRHKLNEHWIFNAQAAYMTTKWGGTTLGINGLSPTKDTIYRANNYNDWWGDLANVQLFLDGTFNTGKSALHKVLIGVDYGDGGEGSTNGGTWDENKYPLSIDEPTYYLPKDTLEYTGEKYTWSARNRWQALYLQDHLKLFNRIVVTLAGRITRLTTGQDWNAPPDDPEYELTVTRFTPRLGLTYLFSENISAYIMHDESFLPQRGAIFGGGRLPPLTGRNNEVGVKALFFNKQLSIAAAAFDIIKNDVGNSDPIHTGYYVRTGQVRSTGIDFDIAGTVKRNLYVNANYSYVDARISKDEDKTLIGLVNNGTARNLANVWLKYQFSSGAVKGLGIGAGMQYADKRSGTYPGWNSFDGNKFLPAYTVFDASLSYATGRFGVNLNVYNLANKKYATGGSWQPDFQEWIFDIERPLNFRLQTTVKL